MKTKNRTKPKPAPKHTTDLVWVDIALTSSPSDALAYGFMSPDLVSIINRKLNRGHSLVMGGGTCFEEVPETQRKAFLQMASTKWEEVSK